MRKMFVAATMMTCVMGCWASTVEPDTSKVEEINEIVIVGVKVKKDAPFAVSNIQGRQLQEFSLTGRELPILLARTPGVLAWGENGLGTGTTYMRIRGAGGSRINVTLDGVALNSPEDQCVFWANMNSYGSMMGSAQIQRGVGSSTNGDGAFGGTIMLYSKTPSLLPTAEISASSGSYHTTNLGGSFSTGLLWNHLVIDGAYHQTHSDGYIDGTSGHSGSYYGGAMYINNDENLIVRYKLFGNFEKTGQAWNGVTAGNDDYSMNAYDGITSYKDMYNAGLGRFNSLYERFEPDWNGSWQINRYVMSDGTLWNKATDNFWQSHHLFSLAWQINDYWTTSASVHYTHGYGYYNEFRYQNKLKKFGLANYVDTDGKTVKKSDFIRKKGLSQDAYGMVWNVNYKDNSWNVVSGIAIQNFEGNHFGYLTYANPSMASIIAGQPINYGERWSAQKGELKYYDSDAEKSDASAYVKGTYSITDNFDVFGDLQFRHVRYITNGINDKFYANADGTYSNQHLDINKKYDFFNPKAGLSFHKDGHSAYVSYAISHREPERNNFTDNGNYPAPLAERLNDLELGYMYTAPTFQAGLNAYYMNYRNQFVQTGQKSDIGEALTTNIKDSYRLGVEITAGWSPLSWLSIEGNAALSRNHIKQFDEVIETYDDDWNDLAPTVVHYDKSTLAFSPSAILNGFIDFHYKNFQAMWHTNFVSRQYLDNTENRIRSLPSFSTSNVNLSYTLRSEKIHVSGFKFFKEAVISMNLNNIFNRHYAANGWVYSAIVGNTYPEANRYYQIGYMPMAGFNMMGSVTLRF